MRQHCASYQEQNGKWPDEHKVPPCPDDLRYLWDDFRELHKGRTYNPAFGKSSISWLELEAWARLTKRDLDRWEYLALMEIDALWTVANSQKSTE